MKPLPFEAIMALDEQSIRESFPKGATEEKKRWRPARTKKEAHKTLARLLKEKKDRQDKPRFMVGSGPPRLRWSSKQKKWVAKEFTSDEEHGYTSNASRSLEPANVIPPDVQVRYSEEARVKFEQSRTSTYKERLVAEKTKLKGQLAEHQAQARERGVSIRSDVRIIEKRLQEIDRKLGITSADTSSVAA